MLLEDDAVEEQIIEIEEDALEQSLISAGSARQFVES